ncbi:MAG: hypothetical protein R2795_26005 [Saprospiraceae bacterium]
MTQKDVMPYQPQVIKLADMVEDEITLFKKIAADKEVALISKVPENITAFADINAVRTILRNLLDNAIKFTPPGEESGEILAINNQQKTTITVL